MANIIENEVSQEYISTWYALQEELKRIKASEMLLRTKIFGALFTSPEEGTTSIPLSDGWVLKGKYTINRDVDQASIDSMREKFIECGISTDKLLQYKPSLVMKEYRALTDEQRKVFDQALVIKPGAPYLEIALPLRAKKAG